MDIDLASVIVTDQITQFAIYAAIGVFTLVILLIIQVIILRMRFLSNHKQRTLLVEKWRPKLTQIIMGESADVSILPPNETCIFLEEWNRMFGTIRGENLASLIKLASRFHINYFALNMLKTHSLHDRLLAIITLGHMKEYSARDVLIKLLDDQHPVISITAARALMWIDSKQAIELIIPKILNRDDWTWANVAHVLRQANPLLICEELSKLVVEAPVTKQPSILRYLETSNCLQFTTIVSDILNTTKDDRVASVCLHITTDPASIEKIRTYTSHERWHVRMHAASAVGRLGNKEDIKILLDMIEDDNWWVRYRAAQAILKLPGQDINSIKKNIDLKKDKFSQDILTHVLAESE